MPVEKNLIKSQHNGVNPMQKASGKHASGRHESEYPRIVEVKVFLKAAKDGEAQLRALLNEQSQAEGIVSMSCRSSKKGNYHCFTCQIWMHSETDLKALYESLSSQEQVLHLL